MDKDTKKEVIKEVSKTVKEVMNKPIIERKHYFLFGRFLILLVKTEKPKLWGKNAIYNIQF